MNCLLLTIKELVTVGNGSYVGAVLCSQSTLTIVHGAMEEKRGGQFNAWGLRVLGHPSL